MGGTQALQGAATLALLALAVFFGYLVIAVLPRMRATWQQMQRLMENDVKQMIRDADVTLRQVHEMLPKLESTLAHLDAITAQVETFSTQRLDPIAADMQEITHTLQEDVQKIDETVTRATEFSKTTLEMAAFYRAKLFEPVVEIVSFWQGLKTAWAVLKGKGKASPTRQEKEENDG